MMIQPKISIRGAREHYLKNVTLDLPHHQLIVVTGLSGSGKSSLVIDTIYREAKRRYVEFLGSEFGFRFLDLPRSGLDFIEGLPPAFLLTSHQTSVSLRSTVGTLTEIADFLRLLFSKAGDLFCYQCGERLERFTPQQIIAKVMELPPQTSLMILAPKPEEMSLETLQKEGFVRVRIDGKLTELEGLSLFEAREVQIVVDRLVVKEEARTRIADSIELALRYGEGVVQIFSDEKPGLDGTYCTEYRCLACGLHYGELSPAFFSFNSPQGACPHCHGRGFLKDTSNVCTACQGARLRKESLSVKVGPYSIFELCSLRLSKISLFLERLKFGDRKREEVQKEVSSKILPKLKLLMNTGLGELSLNRSLSSLSRGELQRLRIASQIASGLVGVLYILDEPTLGLHSSEVPRLVKLLYQMRDEGNTVLVIEHDGAVIQAADVIVEMGPRAGSGGGELTAFGKKAQLQKSSSLTGRLLRGELRISLGKATRLASPFCLEIRGARANNLKKIDVKIPLEVFCCVTGVSGSGKTSLVNDVLCRALKSHLSKEKILNPSWDELEGMGKVKRLVVVDDQGMGKNSRSNVSTYVGIFDQIRELFARVPESRLRGYSENRFSFNVKGGRCESCRGEGLEKVEMMWMADLEISCEACRGSCYNRETLEIKYKGRNIHEVLGMTVEEALHFFENIPSILLSLKSLKEVGVGYLQLGQRSRTLSSGEVQRMKLAMDLARRHLQGTLYVFDEPTQGLHLVDVERLLKIFFRLRDEGNSVLVIEHHLEVIRCADYIIDMGPGGGERGGEIVAQGTLEEIEKVRESVTGRCLKQCPMTHNK
ncbi:MAG: ABC-ATPase UvrA [Chlamydiae bacterium]|nr:ABC-ATPase UvrA [Chlamydiota bacterium]MBI3266151.1 ABC-ATPase UvrA [Chlamydiota bacterium]